MFEAIADHAGTVLVSLLLAGVVIRIILQLRRNKKSSHCNSCSGCPMAGSCHHS